MLRRIVLSHAGPDQFEAGLLQEAIEASLADLEVTVWAYGRDQASRENDIAGSLPNIVEESAAVVFLLSPDTGPNQWMELAYADAFEVPTFILLHRTTFERLRSSKRGLPPLVMASQCIPAEAWKRILGELRACCGRERGAP